MVNDLPKDGLRLAPAHACLKGVCGNAENNATSDKVQEGQVEDEYMPRILHLIDVQAQQEEWEKYKSDM